MGAGQHGCLMKWCKIWQPRTCEPLLEAFLIFLNQVKKVTFCCVALAHIFGIA